MWLTFAAAKTWLSSNIKWVAIILGIIALTGFGAKLYSTVKKIGEYEILLETQRISIENKTKQIEALQQEVLLQGYIIKGRDEELQRLEDKLEGLTDNLGMGADDPAPESLKEFIKRLGNVI